MSASRLPSSPRWLYLVPALAAVALGGAAGYAHLFLQMNQAAIVLFAAAIFLWAIAITTVDGGQVETPLQGLPEAMQPAKRPRPWLLAGGAVLLAVVAFLSTTDNAFSLDNVLPWILSIAIFLYAFWQPEKGLGDWVAAAGRGVSRCRQSMSEGLRVPGRLAILGAIFVVGIFFYFHNLDGVPAEMDSDHSEKVLDVNDVVNNGARWIYFERNTGREPLEFYLIAALVELGQHPIDFMALKLVTATAGLLVVPGVFLLARELFDDSVALVSAALIAVSKWPVTIARIGLRFPFTPLFVAPTLFFLFRAVKYQKRNDFLMTGLFLGAGLYGYTAFRIVPFLAAVLFALGPLIGRRMDGGQLRRYAANCGLTFALTLVVFVPLLRYSIARPGEFWYRALTRLSGEEQSLTTSPVVTFGQNIVNAGLMFNWTGDDAWPNSIPGDPALDYVTGGLFVLGVVYALYRIYRSHESAYAFVLMGLGIMLLPTALSLAFPIENPSDVRAGGAIPFVFLVAALPIAWIGRAAAQSASRAAAAAIVLVLIAVIAGVNYVRYFQDYDKSYRALSWNSSEVAGVIRGFANSVGDYDHVWIMLYPHWIDTRAVATNMGQIGWDQTLPDANAAKAHVGDGENKLYVLNPGDSENLTGLQDIYPNGQLRVYDSRTPGHDFDVWYVPGTAASDAPLGLP